MKTTERGRRKEKSNLMWFVITQKWKPGKQPTRLWDTKDEQWEWAEFDEERSEKGEARVHGNPLFDSGQVGWLNSTADKRAENDYYTELYKEGRPDPLGVKEWFRNSPDWYSHISAFHIIDVDDPELVEFGEEYVHEQLTSHIADLYLQPESSWESWFPEVKHYQDRQFFNNLANGFADVAGVNIEPIRQQLGLPYEWVGAPID